MSDTQESITQPAEPNADLRRVSLKSHRIRRAVQILGFVLFLYLLLGTRQEVKTVVPHDLFFVLDPLTGIASMLGGRTWIVPMVIGGIAFFAVALFFGRAWCGWLCPMGTVLDWIPSRVLEKKSLKSPGFWRFSRYVLLMIIIFAAVAGRSTLIVLDPLTLLSRSLTSVLLPLLSTFLALVESLLSVVVYSIEPMQAGLTWFDTNVRVYYLGESGLYTPNLIMLFLFAGVLALNAIRSRGWCCYLCPLGGLTGLFSKASFIRHKVDGRKCTSCKSCAVVCPTGAVRPERNYTASPAECITCLDCVGYCPPRAISFPFGSISTQAYQPERRQFVSILGLAAVGAFVLRFSPTPNKKVPVLIRPPGSTEERVESKCIRCGECSRICPTAAIQPVNSVQDWDTTWSPHLVLRHGYCDYSCNACGHVCPSGTIQALSLKDKQLQVIGLAVINEKRCIPFAENRECGVCQKVCPLPQNAVTLKSEEGKAARPYVDKSLCTGCGICEYQCPVEGDSAIRIFRSAAAAPPQEVLPY